MHNKRQVLWILSVILGVVLCTCNCNADEMGNNRIKQDDSKKEGVQNTSGEWIIPPVYDSVVYNDGIYWVFINIDIDKPSMMGLIDIEQGYAIPAHYEEILVGDDLIVAYDPVTHVYDCYDKQWRMIYVLPGTYDYVVPSGINSVDIVDTDGGIHTLHIPGFG